MNDLISRKDAIDVVEKWFTKIELNGDICLDGLRQLPSAYPKKGKWKKYYIDLEAFGERPSIFYCSACYACSYVKTDYCPNCGAYMEESE